MEWSRLLLRDVIWSVRVTMHCQWGGKPPKLPLPLGDLYMVGPPESSSKTACRSVEQFCIGQRRVPHYFTMRRYVPPNFCPWWPWPLTFDLDIQTRSSEGPDTSSVWIWRKSVQQFPNISYTNKNVTDSAKNRTLRSSLLAVKTRLVLMINPTARPNCLNA